jgi:hypothetical protein
MRLSLFGYVSSLAPPKFEHRDPFDVVSRRNFVVASTVATAAVGTLTNPCLAANAAYMLNEEGEYEEIQEQSWQEAWKDRIDKASSMTPDEVFMAARGAGNVDLKEGPESTASKKRRAFAGCRDSNLRSKAGVDDAKDCAARVLNGEVDFMLKVL